MRQNLKLLCVLLLNTVDVAKVATQAKVVGLSEFQKIEKPDKLTNDRLTQRNLKKPTTSAGLLGSGFYLVFWLIRI